MLAFLERHKGNIANLWAPLTTIVANSLVVVAILIAYMTYHQEQAATEIDASLRYVERFNSGEILAARNAVFQSWAKYQLHPTGTFTREALDALIDRMIEEDEGSGSFGLRTSLVNLVAFFDGAQACLDAGGCDEMFLMAQIGDYARDFHCIYAGFILEQSSSSHLSGFGEGLAEIAAQRRAC